MAAILNLVETGSLAQRKPPGNIEDSMDKPQHHETRSSPDGDDSSDFYIIIPANNEENYIGACLEALLKQENCGSLNVVVAANACTDRTAAITREMTEAFACRGHRLTCLSLPEPGKIKALRAAETHVPEEASRAYLDADVLCDSMLIGQVREVFHTATSACYATGTLTVVPAENWITRCYSRFWKKLPFVLSGAVGAGFFAVNGAGRQRWSEFPDIISDDTFVRLQFTPDERIEVSSRYHWPMVEGFDRLVRVRRRQDQGVAELMRRWPMIFQRENKERLSTSKLVNLAVQDPIGFGVFSAVSVAVRLDSRETGWTRGR